VVLSISHDGDVRATLGVTRSSDERTVKAIRKNNAMAEAGEGEASSGVIDTHGDVDSVEQRYESECRLPKGVIRNLSQAHTRHQAFAGAGSGHGARTCGRSDARAFGVPE
jgi:hypothetical protein